MSNSIPRLIPFINWDEWLFIKENLFSKDINKIRQALDVVNMWRIRSRLPHSADSTAQLIEISLSEFVCFLLVLYFIGCLYCHYYHFS